MSLRCVQFDITFGSATTSRNSKKEKCGFLTNVCPDGLFDSVVTDVKRMTCIFYVSKYLDGNESQCSKLSILLITYYNFLMTIFTIFTSDIFSDWNESKKNCWSVLKLSILFLTYNNLFMAFFTGNLWFPFIQVTGKK